MKVHFSVDDKLIRFNFIRIQVFSFFYNTSEENVDIPNGLLLLITPLLFPHYATCLLACYIFTLASVPSRHQ